jgi:hypothetical protein
MIRVVQAPGRLLPERRAFPTVVLLVRGILRIPLAYSVGFILAPAARLNRPHDSCSFRREWITRFLLP